MKTTTTAHVEDTPHYNCKICANLLATLFFLIGGILLIVAYFLLAQFPFPYNKMSHADSVSILIAGIVLIILALSPFLVLFHYASMRSFRTTKYGDQTVDEMRRMVGYTFKEELMTEEVIRALGAAEMEPTLLPEIIRTKQTESLVQAIKNPLSQWSGRSVASLLDLLQIDNQGEIPFPPPPPTST